MSFQGKLKSVCGEKQKIIVGVTGASGIIYAVRLLEALRVLNVETHLVVSKAGDQTRSFEIGLSGQELRALANYHYAIQDIAAAIASGSFLTSGMVVVPCSMRTLGEVASGASSNLLTRAADVVLKERRKLIMVVRETPLNNIHLKNMLTVSECGGIIFPPVASFYTKPQSIEDIVDHTVSRILDQFALELPNTTRWDGQTGSHNTPDPNDKIIKINTLGE